MKINKENIKKELKQLKFLNFIAIFIAGIINAIGVTLFLYPVKLYDAGISGTSMLLTQVCATPFLGLPFFLIILNIPIFIFGIKKQGINVGTGKFGAHMMVNLTNDGPVTILLESRKEF